MAATKHTLIRLTPEQAKRWRCPLCQSHDLAQDPKRGHCLVCLACGTEKSVEAFCPPIRKGQR